MDGSPTLFPAVNPKMDDTPLEKSSCSQGAPSGRISGYVVNPMPCGMNQVPRKPEGGGRLCFEESERKLAFHQNSQFVCG